MRNNRLKVCGLDACYHCMTRTVNGVHLFGNREKEVLRKMIWQVAAFSGVEVLTYCVMANHFHVLVRVPVRGELSDAELLRRYRVLYPKPTKYQTASISLLARQLAAGGDEAEKIRQQLLARMGDVSEYMKTLKQRFSIWMNQSHHRFGTLWAERFKSVLVEGKGNPLQTMAAYIDLNPVRAGLVEDPRDYRFCGYAEAVAHSTGSAQADSGQAHSVGSTGSGHSAVSGIRHIWGAYADGSAREKIPVAEALQMHREWIFGKRLGQAGLSEVARQKALKILEEGDAILPRSTVLRCRVRYFTDGAILGSAEYVRGFVEVVHRAQQRKRRLQPNTLKGAAWGDLVVLQRLRREVFS